LPPADGAARGLLVTFLLARPGGVHVLTTAADGQTLTGDRQSRRSGTAPGGLACGGGVVSLHWRGQDHHHFWFVPP
jgi:hypothetical protein